MSELDWTTEWTFDSGAYPELPRHLTQLAIARTAYDSAEPELDRPVKLIPARSGKKEKKRKSTHPQDVHAVAAPAADGPLPTQKRRKTSANGAAASVAPGAAAAAPTAAKDVGGAARGTAHQEAAGNRELALTKPSRKGKRQGEPAHHLDGVGQASWEAAGEHAGTASSAAGTTAAAATAPPSPRPGASTKGTKASKLGNSATVADHKSVKSEKPGQQQQQQQSLPRKSKAALPSPSDSIAVGAEPVHSGARQQLLQPITPAAQQQQASEPQQVRLAKKSKNKFKQQQLDAGQPSGPVASSAAAAPPPAQGQPTSSPLGIRPQQAQLEQTQPHPAKKSKNKFKPNPTSDSANEQSPAPSSAGQGIQAPLALAPTPEATATASSTAVPSAAAPTRPASRLLDKMRAKLQGGHFRYLNELLYTRPGSEAYSLMAASPEMFGQYHAGFQQQTRSWPAQPVDRAIEWLRGQPATAVVADFGCGDAKIAASVPQLVHSLDLVSTTPGVIACNMAHTPLERASVDAAIFSLALMGTDYGAFLEEAARVLKPKGWLWVAEVRSRFTNEREQEDFGPFIKCLKRLGFKLIQQDTANKMFVIMVFRLVAGASELPLHWPQLKPCIYKRR